MDEVEQVRQAIAVLESQRAALGDTVVETALAPLREKLAALQPPEQQRKLMTFLFMDVVQSSKTFGHLDPEDTLEILSGALARMGEVVKKHEGYVARLMGDGMLAFFGTPVAREDDAVRAVRAALDITQEAGEYARIVEERWHIPGFQVRVGLNTGFVAVGEVGGEAGSEYTAMGDAINMAARMEQNALPGKALISHATYQQIRGLFDVTPLDPIQPKGALDLIPVYIVEREHPSEFHPATRGVEGIETPMVGRDAELLQLQRIFESAVDGRETQAVTLVGEAGVGKSRLRREFEHWLEQRPEKLLILKGRVSLSSGQNPYALIRNILVRLLNIQDNDRLEEVRDRLERGIARFEPDAPDISGQARQLGRWIGLSLADEVAVDGALTPEMVLKELTRFFARLASQQPTALLLEDIHWADDSSLDMVNRVISHHTDLPLLIVSLTRPRLFERRALWAEGQDNHLRLELRSLSKRDSRKLVDEILRKADVIPDEIRELIIESAEGIPYYVEELITMLIEKGIIDTRQTPWHIAQEKLTDLTVPATLMGVLQARLDSLPQEERVVLQRAAVVGRRFWDGALAELQTTGSDVVIKDLGASLAALRNRELIFGREESMFDGLHEYIFKHSLLRDVTYESVMKRTRRSYHHQMAEWLLRHCGERFLEHAPSIAIHYELAGDLGSAIAYLQQASEQALQIGAYSEARRLAERGLSVISGDAKAALAVLPIETVGEIERRRVTLLRLLADSLFHLDAYSKAVEQYQASLKLARELDDVSSGAAALLGLGNVAQQRAEYAQSQRYFEEALAAAQPMNDQQIIALAYVGIGYAAWRRSAMYVAQACFEQGLVNSREIGFQEGVVNSLIGIGFIKAMIGDTSARESLEESQSLSQAMSYPYGISLSLLGLGVVFIDDYDLNSARDYFLRSEQIFRDIGYQVGVTQALYARAGAAFFEGDLTTAKALLEDGTAILRQIGNRQYLDSNLAFLAFIEALQGDIEASRRDTREALQVTENQMIVLQALGAVATQRLHEGQAESGAELIGLVKSRLASDMTVHPYVPMPLFTAALELTASGIQGALRAEVYEVALERGRALDVDTIVYGLLGENGSPQ
jgi:class 3 adenylate cyclase/tetratricopeptide (TPR) repeat protein